MKKQILSLSMVAVAAALAFSSCKKDDDNNTGSARANQIVGKWKNTQTGDDVNNNGIWDASEVEDLDSTESYVVQLNANGTGTATISGTFNFSGPLQWELSNNDENLRIIADILGTKDTTFYKFVSVNTTEIVVKDTTASPAYFDKYVKQ